MTRRTRNKTNAGLTLIELMVAVAIIGILAASAIAGWSSFQLRTKMSEAKGNVSSIRAMEISYGSEAGIFVTAAPSPALVGQPNKQPQAWRSVRPTFSSVPNAGFDVIGWKPEGATYFDYDVAARFNTGAGPRFTVGAYGDADGDGNFSVVVYAHPDQADQIEPCGLCGALGLADAAWDVLACTPIHGATAQMSSSNACGFPPADDF
jgi:prepilin-type N-terminal cleavage/methylation domain-containing protein